MYPDKKSALAYTVLAEFIEGNGISKDEAYQALSTISERVRELSSGLTQDAADACQRCGGRGEVRNEGFVWVMCPVCEGKRR